ncbi:MAG: hypothetical protein IJ618_02980 [Prevotella sp.]|nr:hypothetical protein [Prevotella sp.]
MKTTRNFTTVRKKAKGVHMIHQNLLRTHQLDPIAEKVMACLEGKVSPMLYGHLMMVVRGFDEEMQLEMAEDLVSFASEHIAHTTGVISADFMLDICYLMIAFEHGILKKGVRSKMNNNKGFN